MKKLLFLFVYLLTSSHLDAQQFKHYDFLGAGHDNGITVITSSGSADSKKTVDGFPIQNDQQLKEASRFLPFIAKSLIKFLTTSNPSSSYVKRVVNVFDPLNNFQKVIKAILLDPEARNCQPTEAYTFGKLREPLVRYMNFLKAFPLQSQTGEYLECAQCF